MFSRLNKNQKECKIMNQFCTECGTKLTEGVLFCTECGTGVGGASEPESTELFPEAETFQTAPEPVTDSVAETPVENQIPIESAPVYETMPSVGFHEVGNGKNGDSEINISSSDLEPDSENGGKKVKPPLSIGKRLLIAVLSVVMSVVLFASLTAGQAWFIVYNAYNEDTIKTIAKDVVGELDLSELAEMPVSFDIPGVELRGDELLYEAIYASIDDYYIETFGVLEEDIKELFESDTLNDVLDLLIDTSVEFLLSGDGSVEIINTDNVIELLENNQDEIYEITGYALVESDFRDIRNVLEESIVHEFTWDNLMEELSGIPGVGNINIDSTRNAISEASSALDFWLKIWVFVTVIVIAAIMITLIVIVNRRKTSALLYVGIVSAVSGLIFTVFNLFMSSMYSIITSRTNFDVSVIKNALSGVENTILFTGLSVLGFGVLVTLTAVIIRLLKKQKQLQARV